jgi:hypothetical protein
MELTNYQAPAVVKSKLVTTLQALSPGKAFRIERSELKRFNSIRASVWRYNKLHKTNVKCILLDDGSLQIGIPAETVGNAINDPVPTREQYQQYLRSLIPGQSVNISLASVTATASQLVEWTMELPGFLPTVTVDAITVNKLASEIETLE